MPEYLQLTNNELIALKLSVEVAMYCSLISLPLALFTAYFMARKQFYGKAVLESFFHLPLVLPPVTTGYILLFTFGSRSFIGTWFYELTGVKLSFSFYAAVIASVIVSFPLIVRSIRTAFEMVDVGLEQASRILGAGFWKTFFKISVPLALPGIISGTILAFARSLGEFGATITFAGNIQGETQTLPLAIYSYMQVPGKEQETMRLVIFSVIISFIAMILSEWFIKKMKKRSYS